jgi:hypothetical protein
MRTRGNFFEKKVYDGAVKITDQKIRTKKSSTAESFVELEETGQKFCFSKIVCCFRPRNFEIGSRFSKKEFIGKSDYFGLTKNRTETPFSCAVYRTFT